jgi:hypothetical protein
VLDFIDLLRTSGLPLDRIRLMRHAEAGSRPGLTPFDLWERERPAFEDYQSRQGDHAHQRLKNADHWASFVGNGSKTLFVGMYSAEYIGRTTETTSVPTTGSTVSPGQQHFYRLQLIGALGRYAGRLFIDWGPSTKAWIQLTHAPREITELLDAVKIAPFPGLLNVVAPLSAVPGFAETWKAALRSARGVYLLVCPRTREQYVGSAVGADGFYGRWMEYVRTGHGGNIELKSREPSDYQASILEVAGSGLSDADVVALEALWKNKLRSRDMGLNRN